MFTATQGAKVVSPCGTCGGVLVRNVGQFIDRGQLRWDAEVRCQDCPDAPWCEAGTGPAPEEIRQTLLAEHGSTRLRLATEGASLVPVLRALREMCDLSLGEARLKVGDLEGTGLVGTFVEMAYLAEGLHKRGVATTLASSPT
ncbi:hypothetical protein [Streptomyces sp. NPDC055210]